MYLVKKPAERTYEWNRLGQYDKIVDYIVDETEAALEFYKKLLNYMKGYEI
mgnify:CR=1 FL=1